MVGYIGIIGAGIGNRTLSMYCTIAPVQLPFSLYTALLFLLFFSPCSSPTLTPSLKITVFHQAEPWGPGQHLSYGSYKKDFFG